MQPIIEFQNAGFRYSEGAPKVLDNISLSIREGEFVAVIGANGSGKTTLAKHMNAILAPQEGTVLVQGIDTKQDDRLYDIRSTVGMVFQNPDNQIVASIVEEDVAFALENLGVPREEMRRRVDEALAIVGMTKHKDESPHKLSGGQKQRVAIAGVLAMQPRCIVLDEPTAMLDPIGRARVMRTVRELNRERGVTVVLITHFMEDAALADRVVVMDRGTINRADTPRAVFSDLAGLRALDLGVPGVTELCNLLRKNGVDIAGDIVLAQECVDALAALLEGVR